MCRITPWPGPGSPEQPAGSPAQQTPNPGQLTPLLGRRFAVGYYAVLFSVAMLMLVAETRQSGGKGPKPPPPVLMTPFVQSITAAAATPKVLYAGHVAYAPSPVTGSALFAAAFLTRDVLAGDAPRAGGFRIDGQLPEYQRVSPDDYAHTGEDIGHLLGDSLFGSAEAKAAAGVMTNTTPESPRQNRGVIARIEKEIGELARDHEAVLVLAIPLARYREHVPELVGPRNLLKPTAIGLAVLVFDKPIRLDDMPNIPPPVGARAWRVPNSDDGPPVKSDECRTTVRDLEEESGLEIFPFLPDATADRIETKK